MRSDKGVYCSLGCTLKNGKPARHQAYGTRCRHRHMIPSTSVEQQPKEPVENDHQYQKKFTLNLQLNPPQINKFGEEDSRSSNCEVDDIRTSVASIGASPQRPQDQSLVIFLP
jgi:hypothetical protein